VLPKLARDAGAIGVGDEEVRRLGHGPDRTHS
jgi:hypothetical protein